MKNVRAAGGICSLGVGLATFLAVSLPGFFSFPADGFLTRSLQAEEPSAAEVKETVPAPAAPQTVAAPLAIKEPAKTETLEPRKPQRDRWDWNKPQAEITASGDLQWKPQPFVFEAGPTVRYIDFEAGDDAKDGATKATAWKHHPWDTAAAGKARESKGPITYVFKRGVIYRGVLKGAESGEPNNPIRLTSDPAWGTGEAMIYGSERVTGWKKGAENKDIPEADKVWYADLTFAPRRVFEVQGDKIERIPLARTPNWKISDPEDIMSEWWSWENPQWWSGKGHTTKVGKTEMHLGIDTKHLTEPADYYVGATVRTEYGIVMGTPFPSRVESYDAAKKGIGFQGIWFGVSEKTICGNRYYLEDKPQYLDSPGEFWFENKPKEKISRLYIRLPGDRDPNTTVIEAGRHSNLIDSDGMSHIVISGLTFRFTNDIWDLTLPAWGHKDAYSACLRLLGSGDNLRVANCRFEQVNKAIRFEPVDAKQRLDHVLVTDNDIQFADNGAMDIGNARLQAPTPTFGDVRVLRNHVAQTGLRPIRQSHGHAVVLNFPETMEVAGNILERIGGSGLFLFGGKGGGDTSDRPLARNLVHSNKVTEALLHANDWGAIETWQGGPHYVYNNISGNPNGYWNWTFNGKKPNGARLGMAFYFDGSFKNYIFNNVAWGNNNDLLSKLCNHAAFYEATYTYLNYFFNNTISKFAVGSFWSPTAGKHFFLGNTFLDISSWVFMHGKLKEDKSGTGAPAEYPVYTDAYARNVFYKISKEFGVFEATGTPYSDITAFTKALEAQKPLAADGNLVVDAAPVRDADKHDFHPGPGSALIGHGARLFVPWALSRTVGEWNFRRNNLDPTVLSDDHWYMTPCFTAREAYYLTPVNNLKAVNVTAADYTDGPLENWVPGALKFNGKDQFASLTNEETTKPFSYPAAEGKRKKMVTATDLELATPQIGTTSFLLEVYFRTEPSHSAGVLVAKLGEAGYQLAINKAGGVTLGLRTPEKTADLACGAKINDGNYHHVLAEVDRAARKATIYVDGGKAAEGPIDLAAEASLANSGDFFVGKGPGGQFFAGTIDFLRLTRSTLAESKTTIEELYDWQFDGPAFRDFSGRAPADKVRSAGAFEPTAK